LRKRILAKRWQGGIRDSSSSLASLLVAEWAAKAPTESSTKSAASTNWLDANTAASSHPAADPLLHWAGTTESSACTWCWNTKETREQRVKSLHLLLFREPCSCGGKLGALEFSRLLHRRDFPGAFTLRDSRHRLSVRLGLRCG
jgi:hypothetical protein